MRGFAKERNMRHDPRVTLLCFDPRQPLRYLEVPVLCRIRPSHVVAVDATGTEAGPLPRASGPGRLRSPPRTWTC
jgi:hypothetical protein